jgi:hypothetical protein
MKKLILSGIIMAALCAPLFAQQISEDKESGYFYVNVPVEKVYSYRKGYVVQYRKGSSQTAAQVYIPIDWFSGSGGKGELIVLGSGTAWPYLAVYYLNGEFSHVRLYVSRFSGHETWGTVPSGLDIDDRFENVEDIRIEF